MPVAVVTHPSGEQDRYDVESKDDVVTTQQGYKIETLDEGTIHIPEREVRKLQVV